MKLLIKPCRVDILGREIYIFFIDFQLIPVISNITNSNPIQLKIEGIDFFVPQRGDKKSLIDLSIRNTTYYKIEKLIMNRQMNWHKLKSFNFAFEI